VQALTSADVVTDSFTISSNDQTDNETITISISGEDDGTAEFEITSLTVSNNSLASKGIVNVPVSLSGDFSGGSNPGAVMVNWGDGSVTEIDKTANTFAGSHSYEAGGVYPVTVSVTDGNGAIASEQARVFITGIGLVDGTLFVIGTDGDDEIDVKRKRKSIQVKAEFNDDSFSQDVSFKSSSVNQVVAFL